MATRSPDGKGQTKERRRVSARQALMLPLDQIKSVDQAREIARKLQQIGKAKGPNDPSLT